MQTNSKNIIDCNTCDPETIFLTWGVTVFFDKIIDELLHLRSFCVRFEPLWKKDTSFHIFLLSSLKMLSFKSLPVLLYIWNFHFYITFASNCPEYVHNMKFMESVSNVKVIPKWYFLDFVNEASRNIGNEKANFETARWKLDLWPAEGESCITFISFQAASFLWSCCYSKILQLCGILANFLALHRMQFALERNCWKRRKGWGTVFWIWVTGGRKNWPCDPAWFACEIGSCPRLGLVTGWTLA